MLSKYWERALKEEEDKKKADPTRLFVDLDGNLVDVDSDNATFLHI